MSKSIQVVKLISGDEVICEFEYGDVLCIVKNPCQLMATPQGIALVPLSPLMKARSISVKTEHVIYRGDVEDEVATQYQAKFSGLVVPPTGIQLAK